MASKGRLLAKLLVDSQGDVAASSLDNALTPTGDGSQLTGIEANATDQILYEHSKTVTSDYTIETGRNAVSVGPITLNGGNIIIPDGSTYTIV